ncbi:MAG: alpha-2-macroglobulin family protein [Bacteroidota bacterium]
MKFLPLSFLLVLGIIQCAFSQTSLRQSRTGSSYSLVYRLSDTETFKVAKNSQLEIKDSFFHSLVDSFRNENGLIKYKKLPYGNYLIVTAVKSKLQYELYSSSNVNVKFLRDSKDLQFVVTNFLGKQISDADVRFNNHSVSYNKKTSSYQGSVSGKGRVLTVSYQGTSSFFRFYGQEERPKRNSFLKSIFKSKPDKSYRSENGPKEQYVGTLIFNKPIFRPNDTVKFKTFLLTRTGKAIQRKKLQVYVKNEDDEEMLVTSLVPYRDGGYEGSFVLSDSLKLELDNTQNLIFKENYHGVWQKVFSGSFSLEDYELESTYLAVRTERQTYYPGMAATLYVKATNENGLTVPDGRIEVTVKSSKPSKYTADHIFIKDTLYVKKMPLDPVGETKLLLPENIFPNEDLEAQVNVVFFNTSNERSEYNTSFRRKVKDEELVTSLDKDSLLLDLHLNGKSQSQKATLYAEYTGSLPKDSSKIFLPVKIPINSNVNRYIIRLPNGKVLEKYLWDVQAAPQPTAVLSKDSLSIHVKNNSKLPFWYTVFSNNHVVLEGYGLQLDTAFKFDNSKVADVVLNYQWAGSIDHKSARTIYDANVLNVSLEAPAVVYPGQTVDMEVNVADVEGKPVAQTDVTAYAHTSKFLESSDPYFPIFGEAFFRPYKNNRSERVESKGQQQLEWKKWGDRLGLNNLSFYKFINASELEIFKEQIKDTVAVLVPFVVKGGEIEPIHIIYVDDVPVYFSQADQLKRYAFKVTPGNHTIRLRTTDYQIVYQGTFNKGERSTISIAAMPTNKKAKVSVVPALLSVEERDQLSKYMLLVYENFEGTKSTISDGRQNFLINPPPNPFKRHNLLVGPLDSTELKFESGVVHKNFLKQNGYIYGFLPDSIIKVPIKPTVPLYFSIAKGTENKDYTHEPLSQSELDSVWEDYLNLRSRSEWLVKNSAQTGGAFGTLRVEIDTSILNKLPYIKNIIVHSDSNRNYRFIQPGANQQEFRLKHGLYKLMFLFKDNRYFISEGLEVKPYGQNYYRIHKANILSADERSKALDREIKSADEKSIESYKSDFVKQPATTSNVIALDKSLRVIRMAGQVSDAASGEPMVGANISVKVGNMQRIIGVVQADGKFDVMVPKKGSVTFSYVSYNSKVVKIRQSSNLLVQLKESENNLFEELVVHGYSSGRGAPGIRGSTNIRGLSTISITGTGSGFNSGEILMILDGQVFNGKMEDLDQNTIASINVLNGKEAVRLYGTAGASGVVLITSTNVGAKDTEVSQQQTMRKNFSDYAIWQPKLVTDKNGKAKFKVTFPDDLTSWTTRVLVMNTEQQSGFAKTEIKSFKTLSANFSAPLFALKGDSINVIGKLMNYGLSDEQAMRKFTYNGKELANGPVQFKNAHIDTLTIVADGMATDSLAFQYSLQKANGYFDGEIRKVPVLAAGIKETIGKFDALLNDTSVVYKFDSALGGVTIHAEKSVFPILMDEIQKISSYEYQCNEQLASKLKALLLEKQISALLGSKFKEEGQIKALVKKLQSVAATSKLWGWWQDSNPEYWISLHAIDALVKASRAGYRIALDSAQVSSVILAGMTERKLADQFYALKILKLLRGNYANAADWISFFEKDILTREKNMKAVPLIDKLQLMEMKQSTGMLVDIDWLLSIRKKTLLGNTYWGEPNHKFLDNSIQNSLLAYKILKSAGNHRPVLDQIITYFLEQRRDGQWRNTYESSLILETILPELLESGSKTGETSLVLNKTEKIESFPFTKSFSAGSLFVDKKGKSPVYFSAYQQFQNPAPKKVSQDFAVNTSFFQNGLLVKQLKTGAITTLKVEIEVRADASYVMIEVPIPAGCSYYAKNQEYNGVENHREYFKNKTSIFCNGLKEGKYTFEIQLMPRYAGSYTVNPAKAELMYFPTFYGREVIKKVVIK